MISYNEFINANEGFFYQSFDEKLDKINKKILETLPLLAKGRSYDVISKCLEITKIFEYILIKRKYDDIQLMMLTKSLMNFLNIIFGYSFRNDGLGTNKRRMENIEDSDNDKEDLMKDLISIIYSFSARMVWTP